MTNEMIIANEANEMIIAEDDIGKIYISKDNVIFKMIGYGAGKIPIDCMIVYKPDSADYVQSSLIAFTIYGEFLTSSGVDKERSLVKEITKEKNPEYFL